MNTSISADKIRPSLVLQTNGPKVRTFPLRRRRLLIGSSSTCQIIIRSDDMAPIHAIVEVLLDQIKIFDMNSSAGTYINDQKVVSGTAKIGDTVRFGRHAFTVATYQAQNTGLPPLKMLDPTLPPPIKPALPKSLPQRIKQAVRPIFTSEKALAQQVEVVPRVEYPLAKDPHAEFSEYIFEDVEQLYPIFDYDVAWGALEVIILYQDKIISVDYLPLKDRTYYLVGKNPKALEVEFPVLAKNERFPFIEVSHGSTIVYPLTSYQTFVLRDDQDKDPAPLGSKPIQLHGDDIVRFYRDQVQIFVRHTPAPPKIAPTPFFRRDSEMKKFVFWVYLAIAALMGSLLFYNVDIEKEKEKEKEKAPERIATILYKKKLTASKEIAIAKTEDAKQQVQKSPQQQKPEEVKPEPKQTEGKPKVEKVEPPKKAPPQPAPETKKAEKVLPPKPEVKQPQPPAPKVEQPKQEVKKPAPPAPKVTAPKKAEPMPAPQAAPKKMGEPTTRKAVVQNKVSGPVDVFKADSFTSSLNSMLAKSSAGTVQNVEAATSSDAIGPSTNVVSGSPGGEGATVKSAKVSTEVGSLSGAAAGTLDTRQGTEGIVNKTGIMAIGIPARTVILGAMDPDVIRRILMQHVPQFRNCYQSVLDTAGGGFDGVVPLSFVIGPSGHVTKAGLYESSNLPSAVQSCVINVLKGIQFPEPHGGGTVEVKQPFNFYQKNR